MVKYNICGKEVPIFRIMIYTKNKDNYDLCPDCYNKVKHGKINIQGNKIIHNQIAETKKGKEKLDIKVPSIAFLIVALSIVVALAPCITMGRGEIHMEYIIFGFILAMFYYIANLYREQNNLKNLPNVTSKESEITPDNMTENMKPSPANEKDEGKVIGKKKRVILDKINELVCEETDIQVDYIKQLLNKDQVDKAEKIINELENDYEEFEQNKKELGEIKNKTKRLTDRLADGEIDSESYKRASDDLEKQEKELEEKLWKLKNKLFKDEYEKPF